MATNQAFAPATAPNLSVNLIRVVSLPWLDRAIAAIACVPLEAGTSPRCRLDHRLDRHPGPADRHLGSLEPRTQHRLRPSTARTRQQRGLRLYAPSRLHRRSAHLSRLRAARLQPAECFAASPRSVLVHPGQEHGRGKFSARRSTVQRLYAEGTHSLDSVRDLKKVCIWATTATSTGITDCR
jgi:hypothetical protein